MTNLFPQSLQLILPILSLALLRQLLCLPLLLSLLQHICPKLHPRRSAKEVNIRTQNSPSPPLPLPQPPPALPITPDTAGPPAVEGFMELAKWSPSPIICFLFFVFNLSPHSPLPTTMSQHHYLVLMLDAAETLQRKPATNQHNTICFKRRALNFIVML